MKRKATSKECSQKVPSDPKWEAFVSSLAEFTKDFMATRNQPREVDKRNWRRVFPSALDTPRKRGR